MRDDLRRVGRRNLGEHAGSLSEGQRAVPRAISQSGGSFTPPRLAREGGQIIPPLKVAEVEGEKFLASLGANDMAAARALPAKDFLKGGTRWWPVFDGDVLPGDHYELYRAGKFNDTPVLIGTNSDKGAMFVQPGVTTDGFVAQIRGGYGEHADHILKAYAQPRRLRHSRHRRTSSATRHLPGTPGPGRGCKPRRAEGKRSSTISTPHAAVAGRGESRVRDRLRLSQPRPAESFASA